MNLRDLHYLIAVNEQRHFGKAAESCFVSQPTLSGQLKKLEQELGVALFERNHRQVVPTRVGETIIAQARRVLQESEKLQELAQAARDPFSGPFRLGAIHTISPWLVPLFLGELRQSVPQMELRLIEDITTNLLQQLLDHQLDAAVIATKEPHPELESLPLYQEPFWFAHATDHPYRDDSLIEQRHLQSSELLLLADGHCLADQVLEVCRGKRGLSNRDPVGLRAANLETVVRLVGQGFGCTLIPALAVQPIWLAGMNVTVRPIEMAGACRRVALIYRRSSPRGRAIEAIANQIRHVVPESVELLSPIC
ncbi:LysR family transcriptional regulator [Ectothiorhodospiraceae bacterium BW-2]|nr:LysR family transcriptional regulator [Ectothiorhodospiraceae bacterium BW-2]